MRIYDVKDSEGCAFAFEVKNLFLGRSAASKFVSKLPGVKMLRSPKSFSYFREEVFCEFELSGHQFQIWEPFGDSSRYWIGPKDKTRSPETHAIVAVVKAAFAKR
jgi:hypothetical protein